MKNTMSKKKQKKIVHVLNEDCKACMRQRNLSEPIIRDMLEAEKATLINLRYSLQGLQKMNEVLHKGVMNLCDVEDKQGYKAIDEYFVDVRKVIQLILMMKGESNESNGN